MKTPTINAAFVLVMIAFGIAQAGVAAYAQHPVEIGKDYIDHGGDGDASGFQTNLENQTFRPQSVQSLIDQTFSELFSSGHLRGEFLIEAPVLCDVHVEEPQGLVPVDVLRYEMDTDGDGINDTDGEQCIAPDGTERNYQRRKDGSLELWFTKYPDGSSDYFCEEDYGEGPDGKKRPGKTTTVHADPEGNTTTEVKTDANHDGTSESVTTERRGASENGASESGGLK